MTEIAGRYSVRKAGVSEIDNDWHNETIKHKVFKGEFIAVGHSSVTS